MNSPSRQRKLLACELVFEVREDVEGGSHARAVGEGIFTQGDTWDELKMMVLDATEGHFGEAPAPDVLHLHLAESIY